ncbi:hypothetical protein KL910_002208 [Ogataea haglerorum]|nr:hypothetical protein KL945_004959 [Ogataea haglerorum]KAG7790924.1 hypothetical protein KL910_002208 [Ogataea haglerorum]KAG7805110.1 hypothetical protein KL924_005071 [Ogataea haglerorum]
MGLRYLKSRLSNRENKPEDNLKIACVSRESSSMASMKENESLSLKRKPLESEEKRRHSLFNLRSYKERTDSSANFSSDAHQPGLETAPRLNCVNTDLGFLNYGMEHIDKISLTEDEIKTPEKSDIFTSHKSEFQTATSKSEDQKTQETDKATKSETFAEVKETVPRDFKKESVESDSSAEIVTLPKNTTEDNSWVLPNLAPSSFFCPSKQVTSLFVGDLDKSLSECDLKNVFNEYPGLLSVKIPADCQTGNSLGYGYVNYSNEEQAQFAMESLNYTKIGSSEIRIMPSLRDKSQRERIGANIFISNLSSHLTTRQLYDKFRKHGNVLSCKYDSSKQQAFIHFESKEVAYEVVKSYNRTTLDGQVVYVGLHILKRDRELFGATASASTKLAEKRDISQIPSFSPSFKNTEHKDDISTHYSIFVRNLPLSIEEHVIRSLVEPYGPVLSVLARRVPKRNGCWALVNLTNQESVDKAVSHLNMVEINKQRLFVTRAIPKEEKSYSRKQEMRPKYRLKILITGLNVNTHKDKFQNWCLTFGSIKSVELYGTYPQENKKGYTAYGYVEMINEADADFLIDNLNLLGVRCFKVKVEIQNKEKVISDMRHYPYGPSPRQSSGTAMGTYVNPYKQFQLAAFAKSVEQDKFAVTAQTQEKSDGERLNVDLRTKIEQIIGVCAVDTLGADTLISMNTGGIYQHKVHSLSEHIIKFFWSNRVDSFSKFLASNYKEDQPLHPLLKTQIVQSAMYLGIVSKS